MDTVELISRLENIYLIYGYPLVFISSFIEITPMGWSVPGGVILSVGGFFAYGGNISLIGILTFGFLGAWLTFILAYLIGYKSGNWLIKTLKQQNNAKKARILLKRHGGVILITSMMANLTRFWMPYIAGSQKFSFIKFLFYSAIASLAWVALYTSIGYLAGSERDKLEASVAKAGVVGWLLVGVFFLVIYFVIRKEYQKLKDK